MYINCSRVKPVCQVKITDEYQITLCLSVFSVLDVYISLVHVYQPSEKKIGHHPYSRGCTLLVRMKWPIGYITHLINCVLL